MTQLPLHFIVPGSLEQRTGGYIYDARILHELAREGHAIEVHELAGEFPQSERAHESLALTLSGLPAGSSVVVDGLAIGGFPDIAEREGARLGLVGLVHLLLADETGLSSDAARRLASCERRTLAACAGVLVTSPFTKSRVVEFGVDPGVVRIVLPGTDRAQPARGPGPGQPPRILCLASVTPRKGHDTLVRALSTLLDLRWDCICAGSLDRDRVFAAAVQDHVHSSGLTDRMALVGECDAATVERLYDSSSVFVLPSHFEAYGMVLTEAMAHGLAVVTTTGGAIPGTVPANVGVLVPPGDDVELARALRRLLPSRDDADEPATRFRRQLSALALQHASSLPSWSDAARRFVRAVKDVTAHTDAQGFGDVQPGMA